MQCGCERRLLGVDGYRVGVVWETPGSEYSGNTNHEGGEVEEEGVEKEEAEE